MDKSPDAYRTISEVAEELDLPQHVLRFWETRFGQIKPLKRAGGRRFYRPDDVDLLKGIRHLLYKEGYTIKGVQRILKEQGARAVLALVRETAFDPAEFSTPVARPDAQAASVSARAAHNGLDYNMNEQSLSALAQGDDPVLQAPSQNLPPPERPADAHHDLPLSRKIPAKPPEWHVPRDMELEFAAFHAQERASHTPPRSETSTVKQPSAPMPPPSAALGAAPYTGTLSLGQGTTLHVPLIPAPSSAQVSMFRGGIIAPAPRPPVDVPAPYPVVEKKHVEATTHVVPTTTTHAVEEVEARAVLTLALRELATCRELIEDLRSIRHAAE